MTATHNPESNPSPESDRNSWREWFSAAASPSIDREIAALYDRLDAAVKSRGPVCWASGRCCNFDAVGHRLYVTALEIAWVLTMFKATESEPSKTQIRLDSTRIDPRGPCVFQFDGLCSIHRIRPLGCRVYFCQRGTEDWQHALYEQFLTELRSLHDRHAVRYGYIEWRAGLIDAIAFQDSLGAADAARPLPL